MHRGNTSRKGGTGLRYSPRRFRTQNLSKLQLERRPSKRSGYVLNPATSLSLDRIVIGVPQDPSSKFF